MFKGLSKGLNMLLFSTDDARTCIGEMRPHQEGLLAVRRPESVPGICRSRAPAMTMVECVAVDKGPDLNESAAAKAAREYAQLQQRIEQARVVLSGLQRDVTEAESRLSSIQAAQLPEANEQLVLSALHTDTAAQALNEASRFADLGALTERERDRTQLREARKANAQLVLATLSAQQLQCAAEQAHQRLMEFMAMVAHELRNPLAPIRTAAALLGRVRPEELPALQALIERQVERVLSLVGDLLDVSRVNTGKLRLEHQLVDMAGVIAEAVVACRPAMTARAQHFNIDVLACTREVNGDPARLVQIVSNLLDNASKYTPVGGEIGLSVALTNDEMQMTVSDNGIGITAEALPHIFEPFVQQEHAIGFNGIGLGIGLAVVRELVKAHGGNVDVRSAGIGRGSQFVVTLPLAAHEPLHDIASSPRRTSPQ